MRGGGPAGGGGRGLLFDLCWGVGGACCGYHISMFCTSAFVSVQRALHLDFRSGVGWHVITVALVFTGMAMGVG